MPTSAPQRSVFAKLFSLAWPIIGLNVLSVLSLAIDTAMSGHLPNKEVVLSGLSFATQVIFLLMVAMIGLSVGTVATLARAYGAGDIKQVNHVLKQSVILTVLLGLLVAVFGNALARPILSLLGASAEAQEYGLQYLRPLLSATVFNYMFILLAAVYRSVGNTRTPFLVSLVTNCVNVFLNYGLILGNMGMPGLGLQGAALGTLASQVVGASLLIWLLRRGVIPQVNLKLSLEPIDQKMAKTLIRIGTPAAFDMIILNASFLSIIGMLASLDKVAVAAHGIGLRIQALAFVPGMGVSQATGALVGQALGGRNAQEAKQVVKASLGLCFAIMSTLALVLLLAANPIVAIFDAQAGTRLADLSVMWIQLLGYGMPLIGLHIAYIGMLRGCGQTNTSLKINFYTTLFFQIPLSYALGFPMGMGVFGVWVAFPISYVIRTFWSYLVYREGSWAKEGARI